ncbi:MAG: M23 family metallopeptidase [Candidatus Cloacimonadales bacterium]|nr:M23 family metallopeptidase [Candidatus Cloacimonadales bacterium]
MSKYLLILVIIILIVALIFCLSENKKLKDKLSKTLHELDVSLKYIQYLTQQTKESSSLRELNKDDRMRTLLKDYLSDHVEEQDSVFSRDESENLNIPDLIPIMGEYAISQRFSDKHPALDFAAGEGTEVVSAASGEVLSVYEDQYFGNVMIVDHLNEYATLYAHLATAIYEPGAAVKKGETIGLVGNTGFSSAPHLHFEILKNGENINPESVLKK